MSREQAAGGRGHDRAYKAIARWIFANPIPALTILGLAFYCALRIAYTSFYNEFDVTPEQVGLTYVETLSRSAILVGTALLVCLILGLVCFTVLYFGRAILRAMPVVGRWERLHQEGWLEGQAAILLVGGLALAALLVGTMTVDEAHITATNIKAGRDSGSNTFDLFSAEPVSLYWTGKIPEGMEGLSSDVLVSLGESGGTTYIYDVDAKGTVRIPSDLIVLYSSTKGR